MRAMQKPDWIAVDWGTSNLRAWAMTNEGVTLDHAESDQGMGSLTPVAFEPALLSIIEHWLTDKITPLLACGMVGAKQGWIEAAYRKVPCAPHGDQLTQAPTQDPRINVQILAGLSQNTPPDVMRGEETQIAGYLLKNPEFDGILCLPGTHSKWVHISAGKIVSFRTFMSGELFALLSEQSVLRHSVGEGWDEEAFLQSADTALSRPESLGARLFGLRAASLLHDQSPAIARAQLSGLIIGSELAAAKPYWLGQQVVLIGAPNLTARYASALTAQGLTPEVADSATLTRAGLFAAFRAQTGH